MNKSFFLAILLVILLLSACSSSDDACEDITLATEQIQACQALHHQIIKTKGQPLLRTELERRYQQDCIDMRYYRDEQQVAICGNKKKIEQREEELIEKIVENEAKAGEVKGK